MSCFKWSMRCCFQWEANRSATSAAPPPHPPPRCRFFLLFFVCFGCFSFLVILAGFSFLVILCLLWFGITSLCWRVRCKLRLQPVPGWSEDDPVFDFQVCFSASSSRPWSVPMASGGWSRKSVGWFWHWMMPSRRRSCGPASRGQLWRRRGCGECS